MSYIASVWNHLRLVQAWATAQNAQLAIDGRSFELEVKGRHRYFNLAPRFFARRDGRTSYVVEPWAEGIVGFAGWLPYRLVSWQLSTDKLAFDAHMRSLGLRVPRLFKADQKPDVAYIVKRAQGSFGERITGPCLPGSAAPLEEGEFRQAFVPGRNLKVWFWGRQPIYAHLTDYPEVVGDGASDLQTLCARQQPALGTTDDDADAADIFAAALAFQGLTIGSVLAEGRRAWVDFRYGRAYGPPRRGATPYDNALSTLHEPVAQQISEMGRVIGDHLEPQFRVPVLYSVDAVVDRDHQVWWLEANANPALPPDGYFPILDTLFEVTTPWPAS